MNPSTVLKALGVVLMTVVFVHLWGTPWGLVAGAGVALMVLP